MEARGVALHGAGDPGNTTRPRNATFASGERASSGLRGSPHTSQGLRRLPSSSARCKRHVGPAVNPWQASAIPHVGRSLPGSDLSGILPVQVSRTFRIYEHRIAHFHAMSTNRTPRTCMTHNLSTSNRTTSPLIDPPLAGGCLIPGACHRGHIRFTANRNRTPRPGWRRVFESIGRRRRHVAGAPESRGTDADSVDGAAGSP
jgi:hypothetical protein